jgi:hypothetical protein
VPVFPFLIFVPLYNYCCSNQVVVFMEGVLKAGVHSPKTDGMVLEQLYPGYGHKKFYKLHLDLLLFQMQCPHVSGVPLMDIVTVSDDGSRQAVAVYSRSSSVWPTVLVEGESCCVLQLLGLTQFRVVPRHPQHQNPKFINWCMDYWGRVVTTLYRLVQQQLVNDAGSSAIEPILLLK